MSLLGIDLGNLGRWTEEASMQAEASRTRAYAEATNDDHPLHLSGAIAPPLFAAVAISEPIAKALDLLIAREEHRWGLHAGQDMTFHAPIVPGMRLHSRAAPVGVQPKPRGTNIVIRAETCDESGALLVVQYLTLFFRKRYDGEPVGEMPPEHRIPPEARAAARAAGLVFTAESTVALDQTMRYAEASGDHNRIHLDQEWAISVGLPGIIVHGMCTLAMASRAVLRAACGDDPLRLRRLAVRFARPVFPGQRITTLVWPAETSAGRATYGFETLNPDGKAVLTDGLAEVASADRG
jgi:acyl dehydratase